jgi:hypothetical protein
VSASVSSRHQTRRHFQLNQQNLPTPAVGLPH